MPILGYLVFWEVFDLKYLMGNRILGIKVDILNRQDSVSKIVTWAKEKKSTQTKLIITAYSEFFVKANTDPDFKHVMNSADLVTPDGISVLAASRYIELTKGKSLGYKLLTGFGLGIDIITGSLGDTVTGVWLFEELCRISGMNGWKVFLLGGWSDTAERTATMLLKRFPGIKVRYDKGEAKVGTDKKVNEEVIKKINEYSPEFLFVTYNPVKQEKWIYENRDRLKAKVAIGLGGTFNEFLGDFKKAPRWMEKTGLKWLWRLIQEPKRFGRIMRAVIVFPWLVFKESINS